MWVTRLTADLLRQGATPVWISCEARFADTMFPVIPNKTIGIDPAVVWFASDVVLAILSGVIARTVALVRSNRVDASPIFNAWMLQAFVDICTTVRPAVPRCTIASIRAKGVDTC
jgi:hypothetical protein